MPKKNNQSVSIKSVQQASKITSVDIDTVKRDKNSVNNSNNSTKK